jgi:hypothetical protein
MKINKILAAGVAATLAVTSLSAVVSAETKSMDFDMETTLGKVTYGGKVSGSQDVTPGDAFKYVEKETFGYKAAGVPEAAVDTNDDGVVNYQDIDAFIPLIVDAPDEALDLIDKAGGLEVTITGKVLGTTTGALVPETQVVKAVKVAKVTDDTAGAQIADANYILPIYVTDAPGNAFLPERFVQIDNIKVTANGIKDITIAGLSKAEYNGVSSKVDVWDANALKLNTKSPLYNKDKHEGGYYVHDVDNVYDYEYTWGTDAVVSISLPAVVDGNAVVVYAVSAAADKGDKLEINGTQVALADANDGTTAKGGTLTAEIETLIRGGVRVGWQAKEAKTENHFAFVEKTTNDAIIYRDDCWLLSGADAYTAGTPAAIGVGAYTTDVNQSYLDSGLGDTPRYFGGLASQCADFFNKQTNGKIVFKFTANASSDTWKNGGVPSTEVGLKNSLAGTAMALFFNYNQSTGSLVSIGEVDAEAATITFDISNILDDMGGLVKGNISDIYYGLNKGLTYKSDIYGKTKVGYIVEKVTLQYDDAPAAVDPATDDDADDDAAVVVADDDDDDDVVADDDVIADDDDDIAEDDDIIEDDDDDDDAGEIIADDDDDDDDVNNEVDYVDADDDANPGTGVGLAVIPAIVAAAAAIVSKKRK